VVVITGFPPHAQRRPARDNGNVCRARASRYNAAKKGIARGGIAMISGAMGMLARIAAAAMIAALPLAAASAQSVADFYKGRNVEIDIGYTAGGGYDLYARMLARHIGKHIPGNPTVVPKNMEGAASLRMSNWLYAAAPKDGTVIGAMSRGAAFDPLLGNKGAQFDASKFIWLGSANNEVSVCIALKSSGVTKFNDVMTKPLTIGSNGVADDTYQFPAVTNAALGTKFKIITGYPGGNDITLALERNEVQGRCGWSWSSIKATRMDWVNSGKMIVLVQFSLAKHPDLPNVPLVMDLAKTDEQRQIFKLIFARQVMGRPFALPPNVPHDRAAALRHAFDEAMTDKDFLAEAQKAKFEITPVSGDKIDALVKEVYETPPEIAKKAAAMLK
jgi:tripartite-type tricarboxylate transporter receptor subunit TctC